MKKLVPQIVNRTPKFIEKVKFDLFIAFCLSKSFSSLDAQYLVINKKLYRWFNKQIAMLEDEFLYSVSNKQIFVQSPMELYGLYHFRISKVNKLTPLRILNEIRKTEKPQMGIQFQNTCLN